MILIPEHTIKAIVSGVVTTLEKDAMNYRNADDTILHQIFGELSVGADYKYVTQAKEIFGRGRGSARRIQVKMSFDGETSSPPLIYITNGTSETRFIPINDLPDDAEVESFDGRMSGMKMARFKERSSVVIVSDSIEEMVIIYHALRAVLIVCKDTLNLSGIENLRIGGGDVRADGDLIPKGLFTRMISLDYEYEIQVPSMTRNHIRIAGMVVDNSTMVSSPDIGND